MEKDFGAMSYMQIMDKPSAEAQKLGASICKGHPFSEAARRRTRFHWYRPRRVSPVQQHGLPRVTAQAIDSVETYLTYSRC